MVVLALQVVLVVVAAMPRLATVAQVAKAAMADREARAVADSPELAHRALTPVPAETGRLAASEDLQYLAMAATVVQAVTLELAETVVREESAEQAETPETPETAERVARAAVRPTAPMATAVTAAIPETVDSAVTAAMETR